MLPPIRYRKDRISKYWHSKQWLEENYTNKNISITKLAKDIKCDRNSLSKWIAFFGLQTKPKSEIQSGENNPFYGKKHTQDTKEKMRGFRESVTGENNHNWKGGVGRQKWYGKNWVKQKKLCRARDENTCQKCGAKDNYGCKNMDVHHKIPFRSFTSWEEANNINNLICLCSKCHTQEDKLLRKYYD